MSSPDVINLYSDTQTQPTEDMRRAIASADVADEQRLADPTTNLLQERVAELLGQEAALFLPTGTMCNQISFRLHARPGGDELILDRTAHPIIAEAGGPGPELAADDPRARRRRRDLHRRAGRGGGARPHEPLPAALARWSRSSRRRTWAAAASGRREQVREVLEVARAHGLRAHMDGARLMNAVVASGTSAAEFAGGFDTAWLDFTKGLGAPVGAVLARVARADRRGVALEAADGRGVQAVGDRRRGLPVRARPPRRAAGGRPRERARARGGAGRARLRGDRARDEHRRSSAHPTASCGGCPSAASS